MKETRKDIANETIRILEIGHYDTASKTVSIAESVRLMIEGTKLYTSEELEQLVEIVLDRDSVCAGDDCESHEKPMMIGKSSSLDEVVMMIVNSNYLALIYGGLATWEVVVDCPVAVVAQQWSHPRYLVEASKPFLDYCKNRKIFFRYHQQKSPDSIFEILRQQHMNQLTMQDRISGILFGRAVGDSSHSLLKSFPGSMLKNFFRDRFCTIFCVDAE